MNARYGLWFLSLCCISLAGCSNWQSKMGVRSPGSAASASPIAAPVGSPVLSAPSNLDFNASPAGASMQSDMNSGLPPLSAPVGQKLDLSSASTNPPERETASKASSSRAMYNLGDESKSSSQKSSEKSSSGKSSAITKLANKASEKTAPSPKPEKTVASTKPAKSSLSTVQKLSMEASKADDTPKVVKTEPAEEKPASQGVATSPPPTPNKVAVDNSPTAGIDTTLLAQPVRKGTSNDKSDSDSKGPQSRVMPMKSILSTKKPLIYPVSNPVHDEPVNLIRFS